MNSKVQTNKTRSTQPRRSQQQRSVETRLKIIKAAMTVFGQLGFDGATTRGIADAAQITHSLLLYHFGSKDALWHETVKEVVSWSSRRQFGLIGPVRARDPVATLKRNFAHYIRFSAANPDFFRMLTHENRKPSPRLDWLVKNHTGPTIAYLSKLVRKAQAMGVFVRGDPTTLIYLFHGAATSPYRSAQEVKMITGRAPNAAKAIEAHIEYCERLFFRNPTD